MKSFPAILLAIWVAASGVIFFSAAQAGGLAQMPLLIGNTVLTLITYISFSIIAKSLRQQNPRALLNAKMSGMLLKFFTSIGLLLAYIFITGRTQASKPTIFFFLGLYVVYMVIEAGFLSKLAKKG